MAITMTEDEIHAVIDSILADVAKHDAKLDGYVKRGGVSTRTMAAWTKKSYQLGVALEHYTAMLPAKPSIMSWVEKG